MRTIPEDKTHVRYLVHSPPEAEYLWDAVQRLAARVELSDLATHGDHPGLVVTKAHETVIIRPFNCYIDKVVLGEKSKSLSPEATASFDYRGRSYSFVNIPVFNGTWPRS